VKGTLPIGETYGLGLELSVPFARLGPGKLAVSSTPFFLVSEAGSAIVLPIGLGYRFE
jgi:hypothetical protein